MSNSNAQPKADSFLLWLRRLSLPSLQSHRARLLYLFTLLGLGTLIVYATGGTSFAYPYLLLIPIVLAANWYHLRGALLMSIAAGFAVGPWMPMQVLTGEMQPTANWVARLLLYGFIGLFVGLLFQRLNQNNRILMGAMGTDPRTGLPNQGALDSDLGRLLPQMTSGRRVDQRASSLAMLLIQVTDLNEVLEAMGTNAADELVGGLARKLKEDTPKILDVYRFGGNELIATVGHIDQESLTSVVDRIADLGEEMWELQGIPVRIQLAVGSYISTPPHIDSQEMIRRVHTALLAARDRNQFYCPYDATQEKSSVDRMLLISNLRKGLRNHELELFYQPKICLETGQSCGSEALLRWRQADGGHIAPGLFMPKVENTTLIAPVTRFVVQQSLTFLQQHPEQTVSVNFAVRNLFDKELLFDLPLMLDQAGIDPGQMEIEITERALINNPELARVIIGELRSLGFQVSLDDFGTGYSSFAYLKHLPLTGLKIDRAFVKDLEHEPRARQLMQCMVDVANALNLSVTAEGVENELQARILRDMGCQQAQGFLFARPMPLDQIRNWRPRLQ
ncbi:GGDEF domain-containing protein [Natronospirillum operosum]|uniref:GGDEF domain-containing protein n=1 Tax=Natronospirillum operosum TaxID=2759953 RepID=A0A4Z0W9C8_9GAMM|nr:GGDEF domain-containing protein [Natronospirillum operosum]